MTAVWARPLLDGPCRRIGAVPGRGSGSPVLTSVDQWSVPASVSDPTFSNSKATQAGPSALEATASDGLIIWTALNAEVCSGRAVYKEFGRMQVATGPIGQDCDKHMASYYDDLESGGHNECWYPNINCQNSLNGSDSMVEYPPNTHSHQGQRIDPQAPLQVYDIRTIHWNATLMETPGAYYHGPCSYQNNVPTTYHSSNGFEGDETDQFPLHWSSSQAAFCSSLQASLSLSASCPLPAFANRPSMTAQSYDAKRESLSSSDANGLMETPEALHGIVTAPESHSANDPRPFEDGLASRPQDPRFPGDEYTARWIRGDGYERAGWCSRCSTWHKLKDSAYWYHLHYSHGISYATGKPFVLPLEARSVQGAIGYEVLCGTCNQWVSVGRAERWRTPYFRHAYKCQSKNRPQLQRTHSRSKSGSPRKSAARPSKAR